MRQIKLSGREATVIRALGFANGQTGQELLENTRLVNEDLTDILNGLMVAGYVESVPYAEEVSAADTAATTFEVNSAYAHELRAAIGLNRRRGD